MRKKYRNIIIVLALLIEFFYIYLFVIKETTNSQFITSTISMVLLIIAMVLSNYEEKTKK